MDLDISMERTVKLLYLVGRREGHIRFYVMARYMWANSNCKDSFKSRNDKVNPQRNNKICKFCHIYKLAKVIMSQTYLSY